MTSAQEEMSINIERWPVKRYEDVHKGYPMSVHQKPDGRWFVKYRTDGKEKREYFGRGDIAESKARRKDDEIREERGRGPYATSALTVGHLLSHYHQQHATRKSTFTSDFYRIDRLLGPSLGHLPTDRLTNEILNKYVRERVASGVKLRTIDREIDVLRSAFNWAHDQEPPLVVKNPLSKFRIKGAMADSIAPAPPTSEEVAAILAHAPPHLARAILLGWHCGMRPGAECNGIRWQDVNFESHEIRIVGARKGGPAVRYVPIHQDLRDLLTAWRQLDRAQLEGAPAAALEKLPVVHYRLRPVVCLRGAWDRAKKKAGISRRLRLYDLRHAMATLALKNGANLKAVSEVLGHSRPDTTLLVYQHVSTDQHREAVAKIPGLTWSPALVTTSGHRNKKSK